ncbi:unnamed protein product, partial [marine sediment metagenome]
CIPLGLDGVVTGDVVVGRLTGDGEEMVFLGSSNGLYVVAPGGVAKSFVFTPFGVGYVSLIEDVSGDDVRDIVLTLNDADVPSLRCYDGATWQKIWHFAPTQRAFVDNVGWTQVQFGITDLQIAHGASSPHVVITADRSVFSLDAHNGELLWRMETASKLGSIAVVSDIVGDGVDEVVVASECGVLYLLDGITGTLRWSMKVREHTSVFPDGTSDTFQPRIGGVVSFDKDNGMVVVASGDGKVRLLNLRKREIDWEFSVITEGDVQEDLRVSVVPDVTGDGRQEILVSRGYAGSYPPLSGATEQTEVVLLDADGNQVWRKNLYLWRHYGAEVASLSKVPVILEPEGQEVRIVDVATGDLLQTLPVRTLSGGPALVKQFNEHSYLLISDDSDLTVISESGGMLWHYPRIDDVNVITSEFTGDETPDFLYCCAYGQGARAEMSEDGYRFDSGERSAVRLLSLVDGATTEEVWSYRLPHDDYVHSGGLYGIQKARDLVG